MKEELGKIEKISFGYGGYQDAMIGVSFTFSGHCWSVCDFWGQWANGPDQYAKWTNEDRIKNLGKMVLDINQLLVDAKANNLNELQGKPVRVFFKDGMIDKFEILKEVL